MYRRFRDNAAYLVRGYQYERRLRDLEREIAKREALLPEVSRPKFVFILSQARAGSTLLQSLIGSTPGACIRGENFGSVLTMANALAPLLRGLDDRGIDPLPSDNPGYGLSEISKIDLLDRYRSLVVDSIIHPPSDASILGFKEVDLPYGRLRESVGVLLETFPRARVILNVRSDSRALYASRSARFLRGADSGHSAIEQEWQELGEVSEAFSDNSILVDYERWKNGGTELAQIFDHVDVTPDSERVRSVLERQLTH